MQNDNNLNVKVWDPLKVFRYPTDYNHALVVLNCPIQLGYHIVFPLWKNAKITTTVDGGTNEWMDYLGKERAESLLRGESKDYLPTLLTGDMDSIEPELLKRMEKTDITIIRTPEQDETDYTKALMQLQLYAKAKDIHLNGIYVLAETSGRFDHIVSNINTLYKTKRFLHADTEVIQISSNSLTWVLRPGKHKILIPKVLITNKCWCGLIPFGSSNSLVSTTGLKWNLDNTCMKFDGMISTSNTYNGDPEVTVRTNETITWTMGIEPLLKMYKSSNAL